MNNDLHITHIVYFRFNERTGERVRLAVPYLIGFMTDKRFYKKNGDPRSSIISKGKRYFLEK